MTVCDDPNGVYDSPELDGTERAEFKTRADIRVLWAMFIWKVTLTISVLALWLTR